MADKLRTANMHFELCSSCPRMVPHRYSPQIELRHIEPEEEDDVEPLPAPAAVRAAPRKPRAEPVGGKGKGKKLATFYLSDSDEEDKEKEDDPQAWPKAAPRRAAAKPAKPPVTVRLSDDDDDGCRSEKEEQSEDDDDMPACDGSGWMPQGAAAPSEEESNDPAHDVALGVLLFSAAIGGAASPLQPQRAGQRPPRPLFTSDAAPVLSYDAAGHVCIQPPHDAAGQTPPLPPPVEVLELENSPPPPRPASQLALARQCTPLPPPASAPRAALAPAAVPQPMILIDLTESPEVPDAAGAAMAAAVSPRASAEERRRALLRQSMPPPPPRRNSQPPARPESGPSSSGLAPPAAPGSQTVTPVPSGATLIPVLPDADPAAADEESPPLAAAAGMRRRISSMGGSGLGTGGSAPLRVRRVMKRKVLRDPLDSDDSPVAVVGGGAAAAASDDAEPYAGAPAQGRRKRLVRRAAVLSQDVAAAAVPRSRAAAPAKPKPARRAAAMYFDEEAGLSSDAEDSGDEDDEDGDGEDDSFVTDGTGEPGSEGGGRAMYHRLMVTPDSARGSGGAPRFMGPPVHGPAFRLANMRALRPVADSPSPGWVAGAPRVDSSDIETPASRAADEEEEEEEEEEAGASGDPNDDWCRRCRDGGDLMCCDGCEAAFHPGCLGLAGVPSGAWFCPDCVAAQEATAIDDYDFGEPGFNFGTAHEPSAEPFRGAAAAPAAAAPAGAAPPVEVVTIDDDGSDEEPCFDLGLGL